MTLSDKFHNHYHPLVVAALLAAFLLQTILSMRLMSVSYDETIHLPAGYTYVTRGEFVMNQEHPPFVKMLAGLPLIFLKPTTTAADPYYSFDTQRGYIFGEKFLHANDVDQLLFWGRLPIVMLGLLLCFYVYLWARELFGKSAGLLALFLSVTCPIIIGHSRFVTTDVGLACFSTMTLYHYWKFLRNKKFIKHLALTGLSLGLALGSKYLGIILVPVLGLLLLVHLRDLENEDPSSNALFFRQIFSIGGIFILAFFVVWATFFFPSNLSFYADGMNSVRADRSGGYPFYMLGHFKDGGWFSYFIIAFLLKAQAPVLILLLVTILGFKRLKTSWTDEWFFLLPALVYTAVVSSRAANIGVRYMLPIFPLVFVFVSRLANVAMKNRTSAGVMSLLLVWQVISVGRAWPDYIGFFNEFVGGSRNGPRLLDDSNLDWGQDLILVKRYMDERGIDRIKFYNWGTGIPEYYGIKYETVGDEDLERPKSGIYVISTHVLVRLNRLAEQTKAPVDWLNRYKLIDRIGTGYYVYQF